MVNYVQDQRPTLKFTDDKGVDRPKRAIGVGCSDLPGHCS
jgi:hypothetical protein